MHNTNINAKQTSKTADNIPDCVVRTSTGTKITIQPNTYNSGNNKITNWSQLPHKFINASKSKLCFSVEYVLVLGYSRAVNLMPGLLYTSKG